MTFLHRILSRLFVSPTPKRCCRCPRQADMYDHDRPWIAYCARCYLKKEGRI